MGLSWIALGVSVAALVISYLSYRNSQPRLTVQVSKGITIYVGSTRDSSRIFRVLVDNAGGSAVTVRDVGLKSSRAQQHLRVSAADSSEYISGPSVPHRLDAHDFAEWAIDGVLPARKFGAQTSVYGFAEVAHGERRGRVARLRRKTWVGLFRHVESRVPVMNEEYPGDSA